MALNGLQLLNQLRVQELKVLCQEEGLGCGGSKREIIERIFHHREAVKRANEGSSESTTASESGLQSPSHGRNHRSPMTSGNDDGRGTGRGSVRGGGRRRGRGAGIEPTSSVAAESSSNAAAVASSSSRAAAELRSTTHGDLSLQSTPPGRGHRQINGSDSGRGSGRVRGRGRGRGRAAAAEPSAGTEVSTATPSRPTPNSAGGRGRARRNAGAFAMPQVSWVSYGCVQCGSQSELLLTPQLRASPMATFTCLECRVRVMDPFNPLAEKAANGVTGKVRKQQGILYSSQVSANRTEFCLNLPNLREWRRTGLQVELRMARIDESKLWHVWPNSLTLKVNGQEVFNVEPPEEGHKRRDVPQAVSAALAPGENRVCMDMQDTSLFSYAFALVLTDPRQASQLSREVRLCSFAEAQARVRAMLTKMQGQGSSKELECLTTNKLKLQCPITMDRVQEPVRGDKCEHVQCFGLDAYLSSNRRMAAFNNRWKCPVCNLIVRPQDLRLDAYVRAVLAATAADVDEVDIRPDGSWSGAAATESASAGVEPASASCVGMDFSRGRVSSDSVHDSVDVEDLDAPMSPFKSAAAVSERAASALRAGSFSFDRHDTEDIDLIEEESVFSLLTQPETRSSPPEVAGTSASLAVSALPKRLAPRCTERVAAPEVAGTAASLASRDEACPSKVPQPVASPARPASGGVPRRKRVRLLMTTSEGDSEASAPQLRKAPRATAKRMQSRLAGHEHDDDDDERMLASLVPSTETIELD